MANVTDFSMVKNAAGRAKIYSTSLWAFYFCLTDFMVPYMFVCLFVFCVQFFQTIMYSFFVLIFNRGMIYTDLKIEI